MTSMELAPEAEALVRMSPSASPVRDRHALPPSIMTRVASDNSTDNGRVSPTDREPRICADAAFNPRNEAYDRLSADANSEWRAEAVHLEVADFESGADVDLTGPRDTRRDGRIFQDTEIGAISDTDAVPQEGKRKWVLRASSTVVAAVQSAGKKIRQLSLFERKDSGQDGEGDASDKSSPLSDQSRSLFVVQQAAGGEENRTIVEVQEVVPSESTTPPAMMSGAGFVASGVSASTKTKSRSVPEEARDDESHSSKIANSTKASPATTKSDAERKGSSDEEAIEVEEEEVQRDGGALQRYHTEAVIGDRTRAQFDLQRMEENEEPITLFERQQRIAKHLADVHARGVFDEDLDARFNQDTGSEQDQQVACEVLAREKELCDNVYRDAFVKSELKEIFGQPHKLTKRTYFRRSKLKKARDTQAAMEYYQLLRKAEISAWRRSNGKPVYPRDEIAVEDLPDAPDTEAGRMAVEALKARRRTTVGQDGRPCLGCENFANVNLPPLEKGTTKD